MKYDNFFFPADDLATSCRFYQDVLDLPVKFDFSENGMVAFRVGNEEAAIILKERKKYAVLQGRNIRFLSEPFRIRTGWAVEFVDPSSNRLGLVDYQE